MLLFFSATAVLAYLAISRLASNRWVALTATLITFSSYYFLYYNDMVANEVALDLFGVMLTFHGMVIFVQEGRFQQLLVKACLALLLGWHVYALLLPFVILSLIKELSQTRSAALINPCPADRLSTKSPDKLLWARSARSLLSSRYLVLGAVALLFGMVILIFNFTSEYLAPGRRRPPERIADVSIYTVSHRSHRAVQCRICRHPGVEVFP